MDCVPSQQMGEQKIHRSPSSLEDLASITVVINLCNLLRFLHRVVTEKANMYKLMKVANNIN